MSNYIRVVVILAKVNILCNFLSNQMHDAGAGLL